MPSYKERINTERVPKHVAVIMDGNGRWAKERGKDRVFGHSEGAVSLSDVTEAAAEIGVKYLTVYAFSEENWNRPEEEIASLMSLLMHSIEQKTETLLKNNIRLLSIGNLKRLPKEVRERLQKCIDDTAHCNHMSLVLALSYSSQWEILNAVKEISEDVKNNKINTEAIDDKLFSSHLTTKDIPNPDLLIRTSGEKRISNFLLWQLAYSELYFTETNWPDFRKENFFEAIVDFQNRERRFGKTSEQITK
jgi:undecaprenyl diphosphate synthase